MVHLFGKARRIPDLNIPDQPVRFHRFQDGIDEAAIRCDVQFSETCFHFPVQIGIDLHSVSLHKGLSGRVVALRFDALNLFEQDSK